MKSCAILKYLPKGECSIIKVMVGKLNLHLHQIFKRESCLALLCNMYCVTNSLQNALL